MMPNMYNSYSSITSLRTRTTTTTTFAFNDYSCNYPSNERCPSSYCSCCCSFPVNSVRLMLPMYVYPTFLYGLRQSTLIHCPPSRRVLLGSTDRRCYRPSSSIYDAGRCCYGGKVERVVRSGGCDERCRYGSSLLIYDAGRCCCGGGGKEERVVKSGGCNEKFCVEKRKSGVLGCRNDGVKESKSFDVNKVRGSVGRGRVVRRERDFRCNVFGDAEAMLSLLSEGGVGESVRVRDWKRSSGKEAKVVREHNVVGGKSKERKESVSLGSGYSRSELKKQQVELSEVRTREEESKWREERESVFVDEDRRLRRGESGSSYYSFSGSSEIESETEVDMKQEGFVEESSASQGKVSRKTRGVVIQEINRDSKMYRDENDQQVISSKRNDKRVGSAADWDWRKKTEKKLTDESAQISKSRKDSSVKESKLSQAHERSSMMTSSSEKQFKNKEEGSTSDVRQSVSSMKIDNYVSDNRKFSGRHEQSTSDESVHGHSRSQNKKENQVSEHFVSGRQTEQSTSDVRFHGELKSQTKRDNQASDYFKSSSYHEQLTQSNRHNFETTSTSRRRAMQEEEREMVTSQLVEEMGCSYCRTCGRSTQENKVHFDSRQHAELSETGTTVQSQSETSHRKQKTGSFQASVGDQREELYLEAGRVQGGRIAGVSSQTDDTDYGYVQSTIGSQQQSEMRMKSSEEKSTSLTSGQDLRRLREERREETSKRTESGEALGSGISALRVHSASEETHHHSTSDKRVYEEQIYSTSKLKSVEEHIEKRKLIDEMIMQTTLATEMQGPIPQAILTGNFSGASDATQSSVALLSQSNAQLGSALQPSIASTSSSGPPQDSKEEIKSDLKPSVTSPSYQLIERRSPGDGPSSSLARKDSGKRREVGSGSGSTKPQLRILSSSHEVDNNEIQSFDLSSVEDALSSAERMHESSTQIVNEFVGTMRHEGPSSEIRIGKKIPPETSDQQDKTTMLIGSTISDTEKTRLRKQESSSSGGSQTKGSSDDMWDVKDHFVQEAQEPEFLEGVTPGSVVSRRTGKSLWNLVSGIFRLRWGSGTQKTPVKSSPQNSPTESGTGETWFSGNEQDEGNGGTMETEQMNMSEPISSDQPSLSTTFTSPRKEEDLKTELVSMSQEPTSTGNPFLSRTSARRRKEDHRRAEPVSMSKPTDKPLRRRTSGTIQEEDHRRTEPVNMSEPTNKPLHRRTSGRIEEEGHIKEEVVRLLEEPTSCDQPIPIEVATSSQKEDLSVVGPDDLSYRVGVDALISSSVSQVGSLSGIVLSGIKPSINMLQQISAPSLPDLLLPSAGRLRRSDAFEESKETGNNEGLICSTSEDRDDSLDERQSGVSASEATDAELKRSKLQRSKQVLQERFDDWEDAYRRENEQRKVDEIFMREALAEAMKAADSWEVPVGAVLVQNGKVIARGFNLVEELRDSTAHAEMICIREASNILRTWRLSETTLYVTLEPCPMCAGAILQARIGSLVWGAPNKLLGADGSWIRLFPDEMEGEERSEVADKPAAPVHPFHPRMNIRRGVLESECAQTMQQFFQRRRKKSKDKEKKSDEPGHSSRLSVRHSPVKLLHKIHGVFHFSL